jgi:superfamily II DNA or RNA helicase
MKIEILDPVYSKFSPKEDIEKILPCLSYEKEFWKQGQYRREKQNTESYMVHRGSGKFLTGLIPRIEKYCESKRFFLNSEKHCDLLPENIIPQLPEFTFRKDQLEAFQSIAKNQRGVIKNATGTGKTVIAGGICSIWPNAHTIFLCHTLDLLNQAYTAFTEKFGFKNVVKIGGGQNQFNWPDEPTIAIATVQTLKNFDLLEHCDWADIVIIDECHHLNSHSSMMAEILKQTLAPIRIGLSAELPKTEQGKLILEGYLGPVISEFNFDEGVKVGILAKPIFNLLPVPYSQEIGSIERYGNTKDKDGNLVKGIYQKGIIENKSRNRIALTEAMNSIKNGDSVLLLTGRDTQHGHILKEMAKDIFDLDIPFIYGDTEKKVRPLIQEMLNKKEIHSVISNVVWKEGINIPSLNHIINVGGEKYPVQIVGRGSRAIEGKTMFSVTDFLDPYKYLSHHTVLRLIFYAEQGWLDQKNILNYLKNNILLKKEK